MPFEGMSINTGPAGGGESIEESAQGQLQWGRKSPRWKRKRSGASTDPLSELTDDDNDLLVHPRAQHASMGHAADSLAFAQPQVDAHQEQQLQQQQLQEDRGSWAALGPSASTEERLLNSVRRSGLPRHPRLSSDQQQPQENSGPRIGTEERSLSSAGRSGLPRDPRLSSDQQQQQQQDDSERSQSYSADLGASAEEEGAEDEAAEGWQSTSKTCCLCDNGGEALPAAATARLTTAVMRGVAGGRTTCDTASPYVFCDHSTQRAHATLPARPVLHPHAWAAQHHVFTKRLPVC